MKILGDDGKRIVCGKCLNACKWTQPRSGEMISDCCGVVGVLVSKTVTVTLTD